MNVENKQSEVLSNRTFKKRDGTSTGDHGRKYEVKLLMLYLLHGLSSKIDFWLASNIEGFGAFDDIFFEYKDQKNKSRIILVQAKHCNTHRSSKNITFEDLFIDGNDRKQQKEDFGLNKYFESHPEIKQNPECKNSDITLVIHTNVNVNLKKGTEKQGSVETLEKYLEESKLTNDNTLNIYEGQKGTCYKIKNHTELKKYFSCGSDDEIEDFLLRIRFVVDQPNHSKLDDIIKKEIGNIYKISGEEDIDTVFVRVYDKVGKWWAQQGSKVSYLTRKDDYFREVIEHLYSLKPREDLFERWNIPPKIASGNFIEREYLNEEIVNHLKTKNEPVILTALYGLGGVGKTQSVLDFIQKHGKEYKAICWFNAKDEDQLLSEYVNLGRKLNIIHDEDNISIAQRAYYVKNWLEDSKREGWLLIYDNVSNYEVISKLRPTKGGKIIVTSRNTEWPQGSIGVDVFTPPESELYVKKILGQVSESDRPNIGILAEKLGRLPLALAQACAYIKENKMTISRYLEIYAERKLYLLSHKTLPKDSNHEPVFITWDITMDAIRNESKLASKLLVACAYLDNDIPKDLLRIFPEIVENNSEEKPFEEVLGILLRYSMLVSNEQSSSVSIHCLVQDVIRLKSKESGKIKKDIKTVFQLLKESFPDDSDKLEDYAKKRQLLPHLETFLSHIDDWLGKNPLEKQTIEKDYLVDLLIRMSDGYYYLGNPRRQKESLERVLPIFRKHYGSDHFIVATALTNLGIACGDLGDHKKKKTLLERALPISEKHYGPDHFEVAAILTNLSSSYGTLGNHDKQKELLERTLTIKEKHYGPDHFEVARTLANLGNSYRALGTPQKAKELLERALPVLKKHYSPDHPEVAIPLANLGIAYGASGNHEKKKELLVRALIIQEKHYGPDHFIVAKLLTNLGGVYIVLGDPKKAKTLLARALIIQEKHYSFGHSGVVKTLINLGNAYGDLGDHKKKKELLERALPISEKHYGPDHFTIAIALTNLGIAYGDLGDHKKQKELLERALAINEKRYGPDHFEVTAILTNLGTAHYALGDPQKAKELFERALVIFKKHYDSDHFEIVKPLANLGIVYGTLGDPQKAKELLERALVIQEKYYKPNHFEVARTLVNLGNAYRNLSDPQKAKELLERALVIQEKHYGPNYFEVAITLTNLGVFHGDLDDYEKQKGLLERALAINEQHYGPDHFEVARTLVNLGNAYRDLGNPQKAKELLERALVIQEKHYGPDYFEVAITLTNLGISHVDLGDYKKQKELLERALAIKKKHYRPDHFEVARTLANLGNSYRVLGNPQKAKELLEQALAIRKKHYGLDHFEVVKLLATLGIVYGTFGDHQKAKELFERALPIFEKHYGSGHVQVAKLLANLGIAYGALGDHKKQEELLEQALPIFEKHYGPDHPEVAKLLAELDDI